MVDTPVGLQMVHGHASGRDFLYIHNNCICDKDSDTDDCIDNDDK